MIEVKTLEGISKSVLFQTFTRAFSDYIAKIQMSQERFERELLIRRSFISELSIGAFDKQQLVGLIFNGLRQINGKKVLYDCATGIIPAYRKQGISTKMFQYLEEIINDKKIDSYLLEVIQKNEPAVALYKKSGLDICCEYMCYHMKKENFKKFHKNDEITIELKNLNNVNFDLLTSFWDYQPSWQNSMESIKNVHSQFNIIEAHQDSKLLGYAFINPLNGEIPQIALKKEERGKGIGESILQKVIETTTADKISIINTDKRDHNLNSFLEKHGFELNLSQYEMIKNYSFE
ncbi:MAG: GNAT family N-acetyltransferase [Spirochaetes bacterium]|nr:GNAT family N-acetyltransferase [Spirochaetota bacterium]